MILKLRMSDGTYFDLDTDRHIKYTDEGVFFRGTFVYVTQISETFYKDYNIPRYSKGEGTPTNKQQEMTYIATSAAKRTAHLQLGKKPRKVQLLAPEEWYDIMERWVSWLNRNMPEESFNPWWRDYYYKLPSIEKQHCFFYLVMVYGLCAREASIIANSSNWHKNYLSFTEDDGYNKRHIKYFDDEIQQLMKQKGIDFPQDVYTAAYD